MLQLRSTSPMSPPVPAHQPQLEGQQLAGRLWVAQRANSPNLKPKFMQSKIAGSHSERGSLVSARAQLENELAEARTTRGYCSPSHSPSPSPSPSPGSGLRNCRSPSSFEQAKMGPFPGVSSPATPFRFQPLQESNSMHAGAQPKIAGSQSERGTLVSARAQLENELAEARNGHGHCSSGPSPNPGPKLRACRSTSAIEVSIENIQSGTPSSATTPTEPQEGSGGDAQQPGSRKGSKIAGSQSERGSIMSTRAVLEEELGEVRKIRKQRRVGFEDSVKGCKPEESSATPQEESNSVLYSELARLRRDNEELRARLEQHAPEQSAQQCLVQKLEEELGLANGKVADLEAKLDVAYNEIAAAEQDRRAAVAAAEAAQRELAEAHGRAEYAEVMQNVYETAARKAAGELVNLKHVSSLHSRTPSSHSSPRMDTGRSFDSDLTTTASMTPPAVPCTPYVAHPENKGVREECGWFPVLPSTLRDESTHNLDNTTSVVGTPISHKHPYTPEDVMRAAVELASAARTKA